MCRCVSEHRRSRSNYSAEWLNHSGRVVHPAAPLGVGGPGVFRSAGVFASDGGGELLPHPRSPAVKTVDPALVGQADEMEAAKVVRQPPPKVSADSEEVIRGMKVTLKKDATGAAIEGAITDFEAKMSGEASYKTDGKNVVTSVTNTVKWAIEIQTRYGSGTPEGDSAYGRGTTKGDKDAGNVSLGFHESCHRNDFLSYFRNTAIPVLNAKKNQSEGDVAEAIKKFMAAWDDYFKEAKAQTLASTDEVGDPTLSEFEASLE